MAERLKRDIRILLVDDHRVVREGLRMLIERHSGLYVVGEATKSADAIQIAGREQPDVILLDLDLGEGQDLDVISELHAVAPQGRLIALTGIRDSDVHRRAVRMGVVGLVHKVQASDVLVQAIERVFAGEAWLDSTLVAEVLLEVAHNNNSPPLDPEAARIIALTDREREVVVLVCEGLQNKAIGDRLSISDTTVRHHLTSIFMKLGIANRLELVIYAYKHHLTTLPK